MPTADETKAYLEIWSRAVDTQMHFNELSVKSRQLGLTFVAAALGLAIVLAGRGEDFYVVIPELLGGHLRVHVSVLIFLGALGAVHAVRTLDLNVYHKMLRGAVAFGEDFEQNYMKQIFQLEKGMTQAISHFSRHSDAHVEPTGDGKYSYCGRDKITAEVKIKKFYRWVSWFLVVATIILFVITSLQDILLIVTGK